MVGWNVDSGMVFGVKFDVALCMVEVPSLFRNILDEKFVDSGIFAYVRA
jgi:hypothetical protein